MALLAAFVYPLLRAKAPNYVWPRESSTGLVDFNRPDSYPDLHGARTLIINASEEAYMTEIRAGEEWGAVACRLAAVLLDPLKSTVIEKIVLCFDSEAQPSTYIETERPQTFTSARHPRPKGPLLGTVRNEDHMSYVLTDPATAQQFYTYLWRELSKVPNVTIDGFDKRPLSAIDRIIRDVRCYHENTLAVPEGECIVKCRNANALLRLLIQAERMNPSRKVWFMHQRLAGCAISASGHIILSEPHEYIEVSGATRALARELRPKIGHMLVQPDQPVMYALAVILFIVYSGNNSVPVPLKAERITDAIEALFVHTAYTSNVISLSSDGSATINATPFWYTLTYLIDPNYTENYTKYSERVCRSVEQVCRA